MRIVTKSGTSDWVAPDSELSFEEAILANVGLTFGGERYYIDCKTRIGKGEEFNIRYA
jgi:hypothetical protein